MKRPIPIDTGHFERLTHHLSAIELGALMRLLGHYWVCAELPKSPEALAKIAGSSPAQMAAMMPTLLPFFAKGSDLWALREANHVRHMRRAAAGRLGGLERGRRSAIAQQAGHA